MMKIGNLADILNIENIDVVIVEDGLVEIAYDLFENFPASNLVVNRCWWLSHDYLLSVIKYKNGRWGGGLYRMYDSYHGCQYLDFFE